MIFVFGNELGASIVYQEDTLTSEEKAKSIAVERLPKPEIIDGKVAVLKINTSDNTLYYDYADKPLDKDAEIEALKAN
ncbi:hypothetical protein [Clostridium sp.]